MKKRGSLVNLFAFLFLAFAVLLTFSNFSGFVVFTGKPVALGDGPSIPISSCQEINSPGNYELTQNINSAKMCMTMAADNIVFDCKGYKINGTDFQYGINESRHGIENLTIKNCVIENFFYGIYLYDSINVKLVNNTFSFISVNPGSAGVYLYIAKNPLLSNNTFYNNSIGIIVTQSESAVVQNNEMYYNNYGIEMPLGKYSVIENNLVNYALDTSKAMYGTEIGHTNHSRVTNNTFNGPGKDFTLAYGIRIIDSRNITFTRNTDVNYYRGVFSGDYTRDNLFYDNIFINHENVYGDTLANNLWNTTKNCMSGPNIVGGNCIGGNYWSDYHGIDNDFDGIGDTNIPHNLDWLPLANASLCGATITVNLILNKELSCNGTTITIGADNIILDCQGYSITGNGSGSGVSVNSFDNVTIKNCKIYNFTQGIRLLSANNNTLYNNTVNNNTQTGIAVASYSSYNYVGYNTANFNGIITGDGISISGGDCNVVTNNNASFNKGFGIKTGGFGELYNNFTNNIANNNHYSGIHPSTANYSLIFNNTAENNEQRGIYISWGYDNTVYSNYMINNTLYGIFFQYNSSDNLVYDNYFNNTVNAYDDSVNGNFWNTTKTSGTNIIGGNFIGGNYWSDYNGQDTDGEGLGDTLLPYNSSNSIETGGDYAPLILPSQGSALSCGVNLMYSTILNSDMGCNDTAITIGADNIILDCQGHNITGNGTGIGINITTRDNVTIKNCELYNFNVGIKLEYGSSNTLINNILENSKELGILMSYMINSNISSNTIRLSNYGLYVSYSSGNDFRDNTINDNTDGIYLFINSNNNNFISNTISNNTNYGIETYEFFMGVSQNKIYNNFFNNTKNAKSNAMHWWNTTKTCSGETNIIGGSCIGGNYWSDYAGTDNDADGIGDTEIPYNSTNNISTGGDYLPLIYPVAGAPEPQPTSGGGGGGYDTYSPSDSEILQGYLRTLYRRDRIRFTFNSGRHYVILDSINNNNVTITVQSLPITLTLTLGETKKIDINDDGIYDLLVRIDAVYSSKADIYIQKISERISAPQVICTAGEKKCVANTLQQCGSDGTVWNIVEHCSYGCEANACKPEPEIPEIEIPEEAPKPSKLGTILVTLVILVGLSIIGVAIVLLIRRYTGERAWVIRGKEWIQDAKAKGYTDEAIKLMLLGKGWTPEQINKLMNHVAFLEEEQTKTKE